jgi:hypothetical protein
LFHGGNSDFAVGDGVYQAVQTNPSTYRNPNATHGAAEMVDLEFDHRTSLILDPADGRLPPSPTQDARGNRPPPPPSRTPRAWPTPATRFAAFPGGCHGSAAATAPAT